MMRITRRTDYAVRVMLALAKRAPGARLLTQVIQEEMQVPRPFLQRIIADLSRAGLLQTFTGPNGGLRLARPAEKINLLQIWEAVEGSLVVYDCLERPENCLLKPACPVSVCWSRLQQLMARELESTALDQLALRANRMASGSSLALIDSKNM